MFRHWWQKRSDLGFSFLDKDFLELKIDPSTFQLMDDLYKSFLCALLELVLYFTTNWWLLFVLISETRGTNRSLCCRFVASVWFDSNVRRWSIPKQQSHNLKSLQWWMSALFVGIRACQLTRTVPDLEDGARTEAWLRPGGVLVAWWTADWELTWEREKKYKKTRERLLSHTKANTRYSRETENNVPLYSVCFSSEREGGRQTREGREE